MPVADYYRYETLQALGNDAIRWDIRVQEAKLQGQTDLNETASQWDEAPYRGDLPFTTQQFNNRPWGRGCVLRGIGKLATHVFNLEIASRLIEQPVRFRFCLLAYPMRFLIWLCMRFTISPLPFRLRRFVRLPVLSTFRASTTIWISMTKFSR